jgi:hypothetical protein
MNHEERARRVAALNAMSPAELYMVGRRSGYLMPPVADPHHLIWRYDLGDFIIAEITLMSPERSLQELLDYMNYDVPLRGEMTALSSRAYVHEHEPQQEYVTI